MLCSKCKKRMAVVFMSRIENGETINEGLCLTCAKEMGIPQVQSMMDSMGITDEDIEEMGNQLMELTDGDSFEPGGAETMPPFLQNLFGSNMPAPVDDAKENSSKTKKKSREKSPKRKFLDTYCTNLTRAGPGRQAGPHHRPGRGDLPGGADSVPPHEKQPLPDRRTRRGQNRHRRGNRPADRRRATCPARLLDKEIYLLDLTALVAGTQFRGQFESRVKGLIDEVKERRATSFSLSTRCTTWWAPGDAEGSMNAANILKPALSRGEIQVIGATTFNEYRKYIEKDSALGAPVPAGHGRTSPPSRIRSRCSRASRSYYEEYHRVTVSATRSSAMAVPVRAVYQRPFSARQGHRPAG